MWYGRTGLLTLKGRGFGQRLHGAWAQRTSHQRHWPVTVAMRCAIPSCVVPGAVRVQQRLVPAAGAGSRVHLGRWESSVDGEVKAAQLCEWASRPGAVCTQEWLTGKFCYVYFTAIPVRDCGWLRTKPRWRRPVPTSVHHPAAPAAHPAPEAPGPRVQGQGPELFGVGFETASSLRVHVHYALARCHFLFLSRKKTRRLVNGGCRGTSNASDTAS